MTLLRIFFISFLFFTINGIAQENYIQESSEFSIGDVVYVFGNDVKLREAPNTNSKVISLLKIAEVVVVVEKANETLSFGGMDWAWYKVKNQHYEGYITGGFLALGREKIDDSIYLVSLKKEANSVFALLRVVNGDNEYIESSVQLSNSMFSVKAFNNQGIDSVKNMLFIDYMAESCGENGGGVYVFNDGNSLVEAIQVSTIVDGDLYWLHEEVVFPKDTGGKKGKIILSSEHGETIDEETNHKKITTERKEFVWNGKPISLGVEKE